MQKLRVTFESTLEVFAFFLWMLCFILVNWQFSKCFTKFEISKILKKSCEAMQTSLEA